jgi:hypothetical protein
MSLNQRVTAEFSPCTPSAPHSWSRSDLVPTSQLVGCCRVEHQQSAWDNNITGQGFRSLMSEAIRWCPQVGSFYLEELLDLWKNSVRLRFRVTPVVRRPTSIGIKSTPYSNPGADPWFGTTPAT